MTTTSEIRHLPADVAKRYGVSKKTIINWTNKRLLSCIKIGGNKGRSVVFFTEEDLQAFESRFRRKAVGDN